MKHNASSVAAGLRIFNVEVTIEDLNQKLLDLNTAAANIQAKADAENRQLTEDETKDVEAIFATFSDTEAEISRREQIAAMSAKLRVTEGRKTQHDNAPATNATNATQPAKRTPRIEAIDDKGKWGFRSFGEFCNVVRVASARGGQLDPRLVANAPTTYGSEGVGQDGGFAVPPDFRTEIMVKVMGEDTLLGRTDQQQSSSNSFTFPKDETTPWQSTGGIQAYWDSEAGQKTQSKVSLQSETVKLNKLIALIPVTDELLEDAPSLTNYLRKKTPEKFDFKLNDAIVNGTGSGQPLGLLNSGAKVTTTPQSGQTAATVNFTNIVDMWNRLYAPLRNNAIWVVNPDVEAQLQKMSFNGTSGTNVYPTPVYLPPGGIANSPLSSLYGRPIVTSQACAALGTEGDIILTDLNQYLSIVKVGGIRSDVSIHLFFDYDVTAFRFVMRVGGQPWWSTAITQNNSSNTRSCIVTLGSR